MAYTVSFQNGTKANQKHNRREKETIERQNRKDISEGLAPHIDEQGRFEIWVDKSPTEALHELLDEAIEKYNQGKKKSRQTTFEKEIGKYTAKKNTALVHEAIFTVGNASECPSVAESRRLLYAMLKAFQRENPNFKIIGAYFHADEPNSAPHLHIDYIAFHKKRERGLDVQIGMTGALEDMGYTNESFTTKTDRKSGAMAQWDNAMHEMKQKILEDFGYEFKKSSKEKTEEDQHVDPPTYKREFNRIQKLWLEMGGEKNKYLLALFAKANNALFEQFKEDREKYLKSLAQKAAQEATSKVKVKIKTR